MPRAAASSRRGERPRRAGANRAPGGRAAAHARAGAGGWPCRAPSVFIGGFAAPLSSTAGVRTGSVGDTVPEPAIAARGVVHELAGRVEAHGRPAVRVVLGPRGQAGVLWLAVA